MVKVAICVLGVFSLLVAGELLARYKILNSENRRKFVHITVGSFIASWPWLISWQAIQVVGVCMLAVVAINQQWPIFGFNKSVRRVTHGDYFYALAILACTLLTSNKVFFALAILHLALADGFAALVGINFGKYWKYQVFHQTKTVLGSMAFWLTSLLILGFGTPFAHDHIAFNSYAVILLALPPLLTLLENLSVYGVDNLVIPVVVILVLRLAERGTF